MEAEFRLMCGDDARILEHGKVEIPDTENITEVTMLQAIQIMDKAFRPLGAAATSDAAFTMYEVCVYKGVINHIRIQTNIEFWYSNIL